MSAHAFVPAVLWLMARIMLSAIAARMENASDIQSTIKKCGKDDECVCHHLKFSALI